MIYRVDLAEDGFLALDLDGMSGDTDVDIHLLASLDADDCIDRGHWSAGSLLEAGSYYVVADTWVSSGGDEKDGGYSLQIGHTSVTDMELWGMGPEVAFDALYAYDTAWFYGDTDTFAYWVTDFSLHSSEARGWFIDLAEEDLIANLHVTHGENSSDASSPGWAEYFSNIPESHQSSLGMLRGAEDYWGSQGHSLRLDGLESGYNDNVRTRAIVLHGAEYARAEFVATYGRAGLSWGCPAVDDRENEFAIDFMMGGTLGFFWYPDGDWSEYSDYLR